jgi:hypothetical protein
MSGKRKQARKKRQRRAAQLPPTSQPLDVHAAHLTSQALELDELFNTLSRAPDPVSAVADIFNEKLADLLSEMSRFEAVRLVEIARMALLPWRVPGQFAPDPQASAALVELFALMAVSVESSYSAASTSEPVAPQEMSQFASDALGKLDKLLQLSQVRATLQADPEDKLAAISALHRSSQVMVRNTSYPDMVERTLFALLDDHDAVRDQLQSGLGFTAREAVKVLDAVSQCQLAHFNARGARLVDTLNELERLTGVDVRDDGSWPVAEKGLASALGSTSGPVDPADVDHALVWLKAHCDTFEPDAISSTVAVADVATTTGLGEVVVRAVFDRFSLDLSGRTPSEVINSFVAGSNPLRRTPLISIAEGERVMVPHGTLVMDSVKENLEDFLKTSPAWQAYQQHRGAHLEARVSAAMAQLLPGAVTRDAFEYFVPATAGEDESATPSGYTKKVEGDHLILLDDIAFIVEDKAVALSPQSRGGKTSRLRTDLSGIITKAARQAGRLRTLIERDGGVRLASEGWLDLSHVREVHTIAVSLDDLLSVSTATVELIEAGVLDGGNVPWTVSLHDLDLIAELVDRPAEFLMYLRRRTDPLTNLLFSASDELDLFLLLFDGDLWAEPDPDEMRKAFPFRELPTAAERRKFSEQVPTFVTSHTDALDHWHSTRHLPAGPSVAKPRMVHCPAGPLVDELARRRVYGWLSVSATLLSCSTATQKQMARQAADLLDNPRTGGGRQLAMPVSHSVRRADGWLLVWATRAPHEDLPTVRGKMAAYLQVKMHQLGIPRGALFLYDETSRELVDVIYDAHTGELPEHLQPMLGLLRSPSAMASARIPPKARGAGRRFSPLQTRTPR